MSGLPFVFESGSSLGTCAIPNVRDVITRYFKIDTHGVWYQEYVNSLENKANPNVLTAKNVRAARWLKAQGLPAHAVEPLLGVSLKHLDSVPVDSNIFDSDAFDLIVIELLKGVMRKHIRLANATKLLHQKRPGLIPIIDSRVREILNLPNNDDRALPLAFQRIRAINLQVENYSALQDALIWHNAQAAEKHQLTMLRLLDILAWETASNRVLKASSFDGFDAALMERAKEATGIDDSVTVLNAGLTLLVQQSAGYKLARLGGTMPDLVVPPRRRPNFGSLEKSNTDDSID